jgi:hypothetical protein
MSHLRDVLHLLGRGSAWPVTLGLLLTLALPVVCAVSRGLGRRLGEPVALLLLALPAAVAVYEVQMGRVGMATPAPDAKIHPASFAWLLATVAMSIVGPALIVAAGTTALIARDLRRVALAALPAALALTVSTTLLERRIVALALMASDRKAAVWLDGEPGQVLLGLAVVVAGWIGTAAAGRPVGVAVALGPVLALCAWPGYLAWRGMLAP